VDIVHIWRATLSPRKTPRVRTKPRSRYHHGALRRALLDAALALIEQDGPEALTLRAVARVAGVSPNAPYNHFEDKAALLAAVAEEGLDLLYREMTEAGARATGSAARLEAIGVSYVMFASSNPSRFRLFHATAIGKKSAHPTLVAAYERTFGVLLDTMGMCQREGVVRDGDVRRLALTAWSTVHGLATLLVEDQLEAAGFDAGNSLATAVVRALFGGLRVL
jgi:AcrR family transcriptional regulator